MSLESRDVKRKTSRWTHETNKLAKEDCKLFSTRASGSKENTLRPSPWHTHLRGSRCHAKAYERHEIVGAGLLNMAFPAH